jgi:hypothetical protein
MTHVRYVVACACLLCSAAEETNSGSTCEDPDVNDRSTLMQLHLPEIKEAVRKGGDDDEEVVNLESSSDDEEETNDDDYGEGSHRHGKGNHGHGPHGKASPRMTSPRKAEHSDPNATESGKQLLRFLRTTSSSSKFIFGHHFTNYQGQNWRNTMGTQNTSDVLQSVGQFPGMFELNFKFVAETHEDFLPYVQQAKSVGAIMQIHWESSNPVTGGNVKDVGGNPCKEILPGGSANAKWTGWLETFANFAHSAGGPLILRLFHENNAPWFWWGTKGCPNREDFLKAYKYTVDHLRSLHVHNVLMAYSPSKPSVFPAAYGDTSKSYYPGDDYVDVVCFDHYTQDGSLDSILSDCNIVVDFAQAHGKVPAICETGISGGTQNLKGTKATTWWKDLLDSIKKDPKCPRISWLLTWTNAKPSAYWVPLEGQPAHAGFKAFHEDDATLFAGDFDFA